MDTTHLPPFTVTRAAIDQIEALGGAVRLAVVDGGCCGSSWDFHAEAPRTDDLVFGCPGAVLAASSRAASLLPGCTLDYSERLSPPRFRVIRNPHTPERCPCNRSFGAPWPGRGHPDCRARRPMPWDEPADPPP